MKGETYKALRDATIELDDLCHDWMQPTAAYEEYRALIFRLLTLIMTGKAPEDEARP